VFLLVVASLGFPGGGLEPPLWFFAFIILAQVSPVSALIFSLIAIVSIRRSRGKLSGLGFAVAGLALSILPLVPMLRRVVLFARIMSRP
jgi:hypothetical protein